MKIQSHLSWNPKHYIFILILVPIVSLATISCGGEQDAQQATYTSAAMPTDPPADRPTEPPEPTAPTTQPQTEQPVERALDGMMVIHIPSGDFVMGSDASAFAAEKPEHLVSMDEYWIDRVEISNAQYRRCVDAGVCTAPKSWSDPNLNGDEQPTLVLWKDAQTYCEWAGGRLPSEAEWEKAARGMEGRLWPWGDEFIPDNANLNGDDDGYGFTAPVGSYPSGASPYGLLDMAGNAAEWVADWYDVEYYARSSTENPTGPSSGEQKVIRGTISNAGGGPEKSRTIARYAQDPIRWEFGLRCVMTAPPTGADEETASGQTDSDETSQAEQTNSDDADQAGQPASGEFADLDALDSYRLEIATTVQTGDGDELQTLITEEWVREPPARRLAVSQGTDLPTIEYIVIGDSAWMIMGESKVTIPESEVQDNNENLSPFLQSEPDMEFVGEETVNGFHTRHYVRDVEMPMQKLHHEIWVVDQPDVPPVAVRMVYQMEVASGQTQMVTIGEVNVTEINTSITIEPPQ